MTANTNTQAANPIDPQRAYAVLICDLVGLRFGPDGKPDPSEVRAHIEAKGGRFHAGALGDRAGLEQGRVHFFYQPDLSTREELIEVAGDGGYDAVIAAATFLPAETVFPLAGVRIGAGTGNMGSRSWGGGSGEGGTAVLMNTPGINSRATAQMVMKAILKVLPDLPVDTLHERVARGAFDTGRELRDFPTEKIEGKTIAIIGYGNIGREVAKLARAFGMRVVIHARPRHRDWVEAEGFVFAPDLIDAADGADVLSVHVGLGKQDAQTGRYANAGLIGADVLSRMNNGAVLVNYDRGELVNVEALADALNTGQVRHAAIDADLFRDASTGRLSGPMLPYLDLVGKHAGKLELLPHAAADTDHPSRVAGAKQAVDQLFDIICRKSVTNAKGTVPSGYLSLGATKPPGIGPVTADHILKLTSSECSELADVCDRQSQLWKALSDAAAAERGGVVAEQGKELVRLIDRFCLLAEKLNLRGPYQ
ncbi:NAD(P)-dependent oxidoreductase [Mesorhizobium opportunistum]|uniref:D-isomer specific 2-hydroxyacid dehydrogenase NAD-binding protein n=1 Tax=Mesorhizobium opportunistum (strain LMG 24607 / HAMBI 3007 / WSM2075) TaxID=536019 RepID=F7YGG2_MESOW|nr:2-hydroxyacid dehydrogenase [Mesorhizobium opportunistum]AEH90347.1 D-isomer specific 2-hydroxyacid dehydrogenase NAD-binding protein [Mesorhizobium opportunistum WSM2075]